jgi:hypothetical protein
MALVRCDKHNIPYNDANPRGCPACAREQRGDDQATVMAELARASRRVDAIPEPPFVEPVTAAPDAEQSFEVRKKRPVLAYSIGAVVILAFILRQIMGPQFEEQVDPVIDPGEIRPLTLFPGQRVEVLFAQMGARQPQPHPSASRLQRYQYGQDLIFDAINNVLYSIEIRVPNRTWQGLRVGVSVQQAQGAVALLGTPTEDSTQTRSPTEVGGYLVFPSLAQRPVRTISTQVRPPNGCYDVTVELRPRTIGILTDDEQRYAAVGRPGDAVKWAVTQIQVVGRSMPGPLSGPPVC